LFQRIIDQVFSAECLGRVCEDNHRWSGSGGGGCRGDGGHGGSGIFQGLDLSLKLLDQSLKFGDGGSGSHGSRLTSCCGDYF